MSNFISKGGLQMEEIQHKLDLGSTQPPSNSDEPNKESHEKDTKLNTFEGVYVPVVSSIWGVIFFLRIPYIISQAGLLLTLLLFSIGYSITSITTLSISAISTNGKVKGGGAYYMISRSLGPEFGGSIGVFLFFGAVLNAALNVLAFTEALLSGYGSQSGALFPILPEIDSFKIGYASLLLIGCTYVCMLGPKIYSKASLILGIVVLISTLSVLVSFFLIEPFEDPNRNIKYTAFSLDTLKSNLMPDFKPKLGMNEMEDVKSMFGLLFPACIGILSGASMSGDLENPSQSIPKGTLYGITSTLIAYIMFCIMFSACISRDSMYHNLNILSDIDLSSYLINIGIQITSVASVLSCLTAAIKTLQAFSKDDLLFFLWPFSGIQCSIWGQPILAILLTYLLAQSMLFMGAIDVIAGIVTNFFILIFGFINLACFILKIGSAPNFRPLFRYFNWQLAFLGILLCFVTIFYINIVYASITMIATLLCWSTIHFIAPPKSWGDVTQLLIYHQVRKYLLRLDTNKQHVKFWRPQILLLVNNPKSNYQLIQFANSLKKGSLFVLGHVIKGQFKKEIKEYHKQKSYWSKLIDILRIKAFIQLDIAENERIGLRNLLMGVGIGAMVPNIVLMGSFNLKRLVSNRSEITINGFADLMPNLPTDNMKKEKEILPTDYVSIIEDTLLLNKVIGIAFGFKNAILAPCFSSTNLIPIFESSKCYIDLWPIQLTGLSSEESNFDSYTMVLQLGCILHMVDAWKKRYKLRVCCFVEHDSDIKEEYLKVNQLLTDLRVPATLKVWSLESSNLKSYKNASYKAKKTVSINIDTKKNDDTERTSLMNRQHSLPSYSGDIGINSPKLNEEFNGKGILSRSLSNSMKVKLLSSSPTIKETNFSKTPTPKDSPKPDKSEEKIVTEFNQMEITTQYTILNELIRKQSHETALLFSVLPIPDLNTSDKQERSLDYLMFLDILSNKLPPSLLVHSKSLTVTTSL